MYRGLVGGFNENGYHLIIQYIPRNMHTVFALLCFVVVIHWLIFPYPSGLLHWHCGNLTIAPVPAKQPWWIWINTSCEFIMNDCITTTKQSTTKPCAYFLGYTVHRGNQLKARSTEGFFTNCLPCVCPGVFIFSTSLQFSLMEFSGSNGSMMPYLPLEWNDIILLSFISLIFCFSDWNINVGTGFESKLRGHTIQWLPGWFPDWREWPRLWYDECANYRTSMTIISTLKMV